MFRFQIKVVDTGKGISEEELERLFKPHYRPLSSNKNEFHMSHGLGLYISKRIIECLNGSLDV